MSLSKILGSVALLIAAASAHGYVEGIFVDEQWNEGFKPWYFIIPNPPDVAGWRINDMDYGFIAPQNFTNPDIICHREATPGKAYVTVPAGSTIKLAWNQWLHDHKGPILNYLADCKGDCLAADREELEFVKIEQTGLLEGTNPGTWVTDDMLASNITTSTTIPANLKPGLYVLRHEVWALHQAAKLNGAQAYPQCINLNVTGSGTAEISGGASPTTFYKAEDPGILFNLYEDFTDYTYPGPELWK